MTGDRVSELEDLLRAQVRFNPPINGKPPRAVAQVFTDVLVAVSRSRGGWAVSGAVVSGLYANPRFTVALDLVCPSSGRGTLRQTLVKCDLALVEERADRFTFKDCHAEAEVNLWHGDSDVTLAAVRTARDWTLFGATVPVVLPEHLMWFFCRSGESYAVPDALRLLEGGEVDLDRLRELLAEARDDVAAARLADVLAAAERTRFSSYAASMHARLARRKAQFGSNPPLPVYKSALDPGTD